LADDLGLSIDVVSTGVAKLGRLGYVKKTSFDGRNRVMRVMWKGGKLPHPPDEESMRHTEKSGNSIERREGTVPVEEREQYREKGGNSILSSAGHININDEYNVNTISSSKNITYSSQKEIEEVPSEPTVLPTKVSLLKQKQEEKRKEAAQQSKPAQIQISDDEKKIVEYWESLGLHKTARDTKTFADSIRSLRKILRGTLFKGCTYTLDDMKTSIVNFSLSAFDEMYEPSNPEQKKRISKMSFSDFLYNPFSKSERSFFLIYLNSPKQSTRVVEDKFPELTKTFKKIYEEKLLGDIHPSYSESEESCFRLSAIRTNEFFSKHRGKMNSILVRTPKDLAGMVVESVLEDKGDMSITPAWLCSNTTFNRRLPTYLTEQNVIEG